MSTSPWHFWATRRTHSTISMMWIRLSTIFDGSLHRSLHELATFFFCASWGPLVADLLDFFAQHLGVWIPRGSELWHVETMRFEYFTSWWHGVVGTNNRMKQYWAYEKDFFVKNKIVIVARGAPIEIAFLLDSPRLHKSHQERTRSTLGFAFQKNCEAHAVFTQDLIRFICFSWEDSKLLS